MENSWSVQGFQFEPEISGGNKSPEYDESGTDTENEVEGSPHLIKRMDMPVSAWCKCGNCDRMPTEIENRCCHENNFIDLDGMCVQSFSAFLISAYLLILS